MQEHKKKLMKKNYLLQTLLLIAIILTGCTQNRTDIIYDKLYANEIKQTRTDFANYLNRNYIPGGNIAIAKNNKIIYSEGMGIASKELNVAMTRKNMLRIGELSQLFTNIIYLKLVEESILHPDSSVQYYFPNFPEKEFKIAIKHLPYHTSGIRRENPGESQTTGPSLSLQKSIESFMHDELTHPPGWFEEFSSFNTDLLGAIMEKATKKSFQQLLFNYITDTLNLVNTVADNPDLIINGRSDFYSQNMLGQVINSPFQDLRHKIPSKGLLSNAEDLVKLGMAILESEYFTEDFSQILFEPCQLYGNYKSRMANGWIITIDKKGRDLNISSGTVNGGGASILIYPEDKLIIAFAQNLTLSNDILPLFKIAGYFLDEPENNLESRPK